LSFNDYLKLSLQNDRRWVHRQKTKTF
jgi:hypothetical protein